jgi:hypothetical protein
MTETLPATEAITELAPKTMPDDGKDDEDNDESVVEPEEGFVREEEEVVAEALFAIHVIHFAKSLCFFHCVLLKRSFGRSVL